MTNIFSFRRGVRHGTSHPIGLFPTTSFRDAALANATGDGTHAYFDKVTNQSEYHDILFAVGRYLIQNYDVLSRAYCRTCVGATSNRATEQHNQEKAFFDSKLWYNEQRRQSGCFD